VKLSFTWDSHCRNMSSYGLWLFYEGHGYYLAVFQSSSAMRVVLERVYTRKVGHQLLLSLGNSSLCEYFVAVVGSFSSSGRSIALEVAVIVGLQR
jgi:hypothetical protein